MLPEHGQKLVIEAGAGLNALILVNKNHSQNNRAEDIIKKGIEALSNLPAAEYQRLIKAQKVLRDIDI